MATRMAVEFIVGERFLKYEGKRVKYQMSENFSSKVFLFTNIFQRTGLRGEIVV